MKRAGIAEHRWLRRYRVRAFGKADEGKLRDLKHGITVDGVVRKSIDAELERAGRQCVAHHGAARG